MAESSGRDVAADLVARGTVARVLAYALSDPDDATRAYLSSSAIADLERAAALVSGRSRLRNTLEGLRTAVPDLASGGAAALFARASAPPYETEYGMAHVFMKVQSMADVAGFYRAFGLAAADDARDRPDHLAAEVEFLQFLLLQEAVARAEDRREAAEVARRARAEFLRDHLAAWGAAYLEKAAEADPGSPAARVARVAARFLRAEARRVRVSVKGGPPVQNPQPRPEQERALCEPSPRA